MEMSHPFPPRPETDAFVAKYKDAKLQSKGSSLKLLMVAEGTAHVYPRFAPTMEWDTCAAHAIVLCAGGEVVQAAGGAPCTPGAPVVYNKKDTLNPFFIVYGKRELPPPKKGGNLPLVALLVALLVAIAAAAIVLDYGK